jgi:L-iditol 2-dehydrogenase
MKALVFHGPRRLAWEDVPDPSPHPGEALVAIRAAGICGSDVHGFKGESGRRRAPMVMGHELAGEVVDVAPGADRAAIGRRVVVQPFVQCGTCGFCRAGQINLCRDRKFFGATRDGGMAEYLSVPLANLLPLDGGIAFAHAALTEPLAVAMHAVQRAGAVAGRGALVAGCGAIGLLTLSVLREAGAARILCTDPHPARRATAAALGADATAADERELTDHVGSGSEVDLAFDAVGIEATLAQCVQSVRPGGSVIALGGWQRAPLDLMRLVACEIELRGSFNFLPAQFAEAKHWLESGRIDAARLVTGLHPLSAGAGVFERLAAGPGPDIRSVLINEA